MLLVFNFSPDNITMMLKDDGVLVYFVFQSKSSGTPLTTMPFIIMNNKDMLFIHYTVEEKTYVIMSVLKRSQEMYF